ncbi:MAG: methyltransferase domain-containing protein, partial [Actinobacteria bacterium]|nr:methyltransferase domain-containing protein [Actinomycetota bacterium]
PVTDALVTFLDPRPGERILELAAGPGGVGVHVARLVGDRGSVLVSDLAPEMVDAARAQVGELGLGNVETRVVDGQDTGLPSESFDGVVCRFGYMLMPDPVRGLAETARVLRSEGRVAFAVWGDRRANSWGTAATHALVELGLVEPPDPYGPGPFALDDPDRLAAAVGAAGLSLERVEDVGVAWRFPSTEAWWEVMRDLSSTLQEALATADPAGAAAVRDRAVGHLDLRRVAGEVVVDGVARVALARVALDRATEDGRSG